MSRGLVPTALSTVSEPADSEAAAGERKPETKEPSGTREIGGRDGPEPTRFGDWEKAGRCIDF
jgi:hypothetical protein